MDTLTLLKSQRTHRLYRDKPIPEDLLPQILEAGRWVPTRATLHPSPSVIATDQETRKRIGEAAKFLSVKSSQGEKPL